MCMNLFKTSKKQEEVVIVFDIGSGSVGGALVLTSNNLAPVILSSIRVPIKIKDKYEKEVSEKEILKKISEVASFIQKDSKMSPEKVYCILSSPWSFSVVKNIKRNSTSPFLINKNYIEDLIKDEIKNLPSFVPDEFDTVVDKNLTNIFLNGFYVEDPYNKRAKEISLDIFYSLSSYNLILKIEEKINNIYHKKIKFTSQSFSDFMVVRDIFDNINDFLILNIDEEFTEISIMQDDTLVLVKSFNFGRNTLIRKISEKINKNIIETKSIINAYINDHLEKEYVKKIEKAINEANKEWINSVKSILRGATIDMLIPKDIFIVSDDSSIHWFANLLDYSNFPEFTTPENNFNVIIGDKRVLNDFCDFSLNVIPEENLTMQSIFINKINFL